MPKVRVPADEWRVDCVGAIARRCPPGHIHTQTFLGSMPSDDVFVQYEPAPPAPEASVPPQAPSPPAEEPVKKETKAKEEPKSKAEEYLSKKRKGR